jgi:hypothetical protein
MPTILTNGNSAVKRSARPSLNTRNESKIPALNWELTHNHIKRFRTDRLVIDRILDIFASSAKIG